jgi:mannitol/fructose-specific phosphotransferase system IIA component (Ntr-type)
MTEPSCPSPGLAAIARPGLCFPGLPAQTLEEAVRTLCHAAVQQLCGVPDAPLAGAIAAECLDAMVPLGHGMALPHAHRAEAAAPLLAIARLAQEVPTPDGPVWLVLLLLSPRGGHARHLEALKAIAGLARDAQAVAAIRAATVPGEIFAALAAH